MHLAPSNGHMRPFDIHNQSTTHLQASFPIFFPIFFFAPTALLFLVVSETHHVAAVDSGWGL